MMTNTSTMEEKMAEMEQRVILLTKALGDKDLQIATLMNKLEVQDLGESSHGHKFTFATKGEKLKTLPNKNNLLRLLRCQSNNYKT